VIVVDTSVLMDALRGHAAATAALDGAIADDVVVASELTRIELISGMRSAERSSVRRLLDLMTWVPVDEPVAERAGALARAHRRSHQGIDLVDYVIAATAEVHQADLWTTNTKHFPMFEGLTPPY
jgi:hypothetical protein